MTKHASSSPRFKMHSLRTAWLLLALQVLVAPAANAIIIRHDLDDDDYQVSDADYPALADLIGPGDCIGTLVHESYLLTVAHCAVDLSAGQSLQVGGSAHTVAEVILHPSWQDLDEYDIALVRFEEPVEGVVPYPIYRGNDEVGAHITMVGRGVTATGLQGEAGADSDGVLRQATNIVTDANDHFFELVFESEGQPGVTSLEGVGAAGDSGCPVFMDIGGVRYIAGLNSYGDETNNAGVGQYGALDYQTRVSRYLEWLDGIVDLPELPVDDPDAGDMDDAGSIDPDGDMDDGGAANGDDDGGAAAVDGGAGPDEEGPVEGEEPVDAGQPALEEDAPCDGGTGSAERAPMEPDAAPDTNGSDVLCDDGIEGSSARCTPNATTEFGCSANTVGLGGSRLGVIASGLLAVAFRRRRRPSVA